MWRQVAKKRPVHESLCWVWRPGWKRPRKRRANHYLYPKPGWDWTTAGRVNENTRAADWWCDIDTPPDPPREGKL